MSELKISKNAIRRIGHLANAPYLKSDAVDFIQRLIMAYLREFVTMTDIMLTHQGTKTVSTEMVRYVIQNQNTHFLKHAQGYPEIGDKIKPCKPVSEIKGADKKGSEARKKYLQKKLKATQRISNETECYIIPLQTLTRLLRHHFQDVKADVRFSKEAITYVNVLLESFLVDAIHGGVMISEHAERMKTSEMDIQIALAIKGIPARDL